MKKQEKCLPLMLLRSISNKYPGCWDKIEKARKNMNWPTWCYIPADNCTQIVQTAMHEKGEKGVNPKFIITSMFDGDLMGALASWRESKEIYCFDPELEKELYKGANDTIDQKTREAAFENLPFPCIWIETNNLVIANKQIKGFFVWRDYSIEAKSAKLNMIFVTKDMTLLFTFRDNNDKEIVLFDYKDRDKETFSFDLFNFLLDYKGNVIDHKKLTDLIFKNLDKMQDLIFKNLGNNNPPQGEIAQALQLVLYLCSVGADVKENPVQKKITKRSEVLRDKYREVRKWDVGVRFGNTIRAYAAKEGKSHKGSHSRKRPHWRKGHFQHYWIGPKNKPEERQLVLNWIQPVLVNEGLLEDEELPAVVHKVE